MALLPLFRTSITSRWWWVHAPS